MHPNEAPNNVEHFLALAAGEIELVDANTETIFKPRYYDGMSFHRVIPGFLIQAGSPAYNPLGAPNKLLDDEINASSLGMDNEKVLLADSSLNPILNITSHDEFAQSVLKPLYESMNIESAENILGREQEIAARLRTLTMKTLYQLQGYSYSESTQSRPIMRGVLALANSGPNTNGPEFFISISDANHLSGKYTAIGSVIEGMDVVDKIGSLAINPQQPTRASTTIYAVRKIN